jgi:hypothetical protein
MPQVVRDLANLRALANTPRSDGANNGLARTPG